MPATAVVRGCGTRVKGGIYAELGVAVTGLPIESFLIDPPIGPIEEDQISKLGVKLMERNGVTHILDWVGESHYPNVADVIEEARRYGFSRRLSSRLDFSKLTADSRIMLMHRRVFIDQWNYYRHAVRAQEAAGGGRMCYCPKEIPPHRMGTERCLGVIWEDITEGHPVLLEEKEVSIADQHAHPTALIPARLRPRLVKRHMPSFDYYGFSKPEEVEAPFYRAGIFASIPIERLAVVEASDGSHEFAAKRAGAAGVPTVVVTD